MPSLITTQERDNLTGILGDVFDTFKRGVVVYKEPTKKVAVIDDSFIFGYGEPSNAINYDYIVVSGAFDATIKYNTNQNLEYHGDINASLSEGEVRIKVKEDCKNFIESGKTERVVFDGASFNIISDYSVKSFLDSTFYTYYLERIK